MDPDRLLDRLRETMRRDLRTDGLRSVETYERLFGALPAERVREVVDEVTAAARSGTRNSGTEGPTLFAPGTEPTAPSVSSEPPDAPASGARAGEPGDAEALDPLATVEPAEARGPVAGLAPRFQEQGEIARGGMGAIVRVHEDTLGRDLAMKVVLDGPGLDALSVRFVDEARIQAQLDHPGVVPVHHLGTDDSGRLCFTMKLVRGRSLEELLDDREQATDPSGVTRFVQVLLRVCETLAFAHDKQVIHRDLKPANIMVGDFGEVYVMDWGLAKVVGASEPVAPEDAPAESTAGAEATTDSGGSVSTSGSSLTVRGSVLGTPRYMPPEQAEGRNDELDARADVYSLGAILYEALSGEAPYDHLGSDAGPYHVVAAIHEGPPRPLAELAPRAPQELLAVAEKAMARDRDDRYPSAAELSQDLQAWIEGRVVRAHRTGVWIELRKWIHRNQAVAASLCVTAIVIAVAGVAFVLRERESQEAIRGERDQAVEARKSAEVARSQAEIQAQLADGARLTALSATVLDDDPSLAAHLALRGAELAPGEQATTALYAVVRELDLEKRLDGASDYIQRIAWSPDGRFVCAGTLHGSILRYDVEEGVALTRVRTHAGPALELAYVDGGAAVVAVWQDGSWTRHDAETLEVVAQGEGVAAGRFSLSVERDALARVRRDGRVDVIDLADGSVLRTIGVDTDSAGRVAWNAGGTHLALLTVSGRLVVWDPDRDESAWTARVANLPEDPKPTSPQVSWSSDGRVLAVSPPRDAGGVRPELRHVRVWNAADGKLLHDLSSAFVTSELLAIHPRSERLLIRGTSAAGETAVHRLELDGGELHPVPPGFASQSGGGVHYAPDGRRLIVVHHEDVEVWSSATYTKLREFAGTRQHVTTIAFDPTGRRLATGSPTRRVDVWRVTDERQSIAVSPHGGVEWRARGLDGDGDRVVAELEAGGGSTEIAAFDVATGQELARLPESVPAGSHLHLSRDGRLAVVAGRAGLLVFDVEEREVVFERPGRHAAAPATSPEGRHLAFRIDGLHEGGLHGNAYLLDLAAPQQPPRRFTDPFNEFENPPYRAVAVGPGARLVGAARGYVGASVWDVETGEVRLRSDDHTGVVFAVAFDDTGRYFATQAKDATVHIWDLETATSRLATPFPQRRGVLRFSPDGELLYALPYREDTVYAFRSDTGRLAARIRVPDAEFAEVAVRSDGDIVTRERNGVVRRWPADPARWLAERTPRALLAVELDRYESLPAKERSGYVLDAARRRRSPVELLFVVRKLVGDGDLERAREFCALVLEIDDYSPLSQTAAAVLAAAEGDADAVFRRLGLATQRGKPVYRALDDDAFDPYRDDPRWHWK